MPTGGDWPTAGAGLRPYGLQHSMTVRRTDADPVPGRGAPGFAEGVNRGDAAALADLYAPDAAIVERNGALTTGADAIRHHLDELVAMAPVMEIVESKAFEHGDLALLC